VNSGDGNVIGWVTSNIAWEILFGVACLAVRLGWRQARRGVQQLWLAAWLVVAVLTCKRLPLKPPRGRRRRGGHHHRQFRLAMDLSNEALLAERYPPYVAARKSALR
jgi:hypothetical protein